MEKLSTQQVVVGVGLNAKSAGMRAYIQRHTSEESNTSTITIAIAIATTTTTIASVELEWAIAGISNNDALMVTIKSNSKR